MEWFARLYGYRHEGNRPYVRQIHQHAAMEVDYFAAKDFKVSDKGLLGRGLSDPLLNMPLLGSIREEAA